MIYFLAANDKVKRLKAIVKVTQLFLTRSAIEAKDLALVAIHGFNQMSCQPPYTYADVDQIVECVLQEHFKK